MKRIMIAFIVLVVFSLTLPASAQTEQLSEVEITAKIRTYVLKAPRADAEFLRGVAAGARQAAFGRDDSGDWLRILDGWVLAEVFRAGSDMAQLPDATHSVNVSVSSAAQLYDGPSAKWFSVTGEMTAGSRAVAIGRNESGSWLRLPQGWIEVAHVEMSGAVALLPVVASPGVVIIAKTRTFILKEPDLSAEFVDVFEAGEEALAIGRAGDWLQISQGWVSAEAVSMSGEVESLPFSGEGIQIVLKYDRTIRSSPNGNNSVVGKVRSGESVYAVGRSLSGSYLKLENGWINVGPPFLHVNTFTANGDVMQLPITDGTANSSSISSSVTESLPFTAEALPIILKGDRSVYNSPAGRTTGQILKRLVKTNAIGRNKAGTWLLVDEGWINIGRAPAAYIRKVDGIIVEDDIEALPITDGTSSSTSRATSTPRPTATPRPTTTPRSSNWTSSTIRSLVSRHTDDIRILDLDISNSAITIEYDLKPWPFVPNELIAEEVVFKIICALRRGQQIPNTLKLIGQGHFKSDIGRKFKSPSVEIHIRASNANRIVCSGNDYSDINWRSVSSVYKSYPIPRGASVDYD